MIIAEESGFGRSRLSNALERRNNGFRAKLGEEFGNCSGLALFRLSSLNAGPLHLAYRDFCRRKNPRISSAADPSGQACVIDHLCRTRVVFH